MIKTKSGHRATFQFFDINDYKMVNLSQKINRDNIVMLNSVINQAKL